MSIFLTLPGPGMCVPGKPREKKQRLMNQVAEAMLFPKNQPNWREAGGSGQVGFNASLEGTIDMYDFLLIEKELVDAGWWIKHIKYRYGRTTLVLVHAHTVKNTIWGDPILVNPFGRLIFLPRNITTRPVEQ